jgi:hypothetical protein
MDQQSNETTVTTQYNTKTTMTMTSYGDSESNLHQVPYHHDNEAKSASTIVSEEPQSNRPKALVILLYTGIIIAMFMVSLNTTVVAPAMSIIATELNALEQQTWVATAYLLVFNAIQPISGKFSDIFGR